MNQEKIIELIAWLTHLKHTIKTLGNYQDAPEFMGPVLLTHCAKYHLARTTLTEIQYQKSLLAVAAKEAYSPYPEEF